MVTSVISASLSDMNRVKLQESPEAVLSGRFRALPQTRGDPPVSSNTLHGPLSLRVRLHWGLGTGRP